LRCTDPRDFTSEEIDLSDLCSVLKKKVQAAVRNRFDKAVQEPYAKIDAKTGIIVGINRGGLCTRVRCV
jgi:hypothetical protein